MGGQASLTDAFQRALTTFIKESADCIEDAYYLSIRGDCELSLCNITSLTVEEYSVLLLGSQMVRTKPKRDTLTVHTSDVDRWNPLLERHGLRHRDGGSNLAEATKLTKVCLDAFKRRKEGAEFGEVHKYMYLVRIGWYKHGDTTRAGLQLRYGVSPPEFNCLRRF